MRIKIVSDGTSVGSKVVNAETGEALDFVEKIDFTLEAGGLARCVLTVLKPDIEVDCEAEINRP